MNNWGITIRFMTWRAALEWFRDFIKLSCAVGPRFGSLSCRDVSRELFPWNLSSHAWPREALYVQKCCCPPVVLAIIVTVFAVIMLCEGSQSFKILLMFMYLCIFGYFAEPWRWMPEYIFIIWNLEFTTYSIYVCNTMVIMMVRTICLHVHNVLA